MQDLFQILRIACSVIAYLSCRGVGLLVGGFGFVMFLLPPVFFNVLPAVTVDDAEFARGARNRKCKYKNLTKRDPENYKETSNINYPNQQQKHMTNRHYYKYTRQCSAVSALPEAAKLWHANSSHLRRHSRTGRVNRHDVSFLATDT